jgi:hypothetical protein
MDYYQAQAEGAPFPYGWVFLGIFGHTQDKIGNWMGNVRADLLLIVFIKLNAEP